MIAGVARQASLAVSIELASDLVNVPLAAAVLRGLCEALGLSPDQRFEVELCMVEAVTNAIEHAYEGRPGNLVEVTLEADARHLELKVRDAGKPVPREILDAANGPLRWPPETEENGRGLPLMRSLMDQVSFASGATGNEVSMVRRLDGGTGR